MAVYKDKFLKIKQENEGLEDRVEELEGKLDSVTRMWQSVTIGGEGRRMIDKEKEEEEEDGIKGMCQSCNVNLITGGGGLVTNVNID